MASYLAFGKHFDDLNLAVSKIEDDVERRKTCLSLGWVMNALYEKCMKPIIDEHPDLDPDK